MSSLIPFGKWGHRLTVILAALGGFDLAAGLWHHPDPFSISSGILCLILATGRAAFGG